MVQVTVITPCLHLLYLSCVAMDCENAQSPAVDIFIRCRALSNWPTQKTQHQSGRCRKTLFSCNLHTRR
ncbi:hypothetical protein KC19_9G007500 [Ceratodon purpureus]|uniref:Secreted protein n=1 Tax=Ceratodon purpureus TaxID=3225 RepID=A0A8T0GQZ6_CERPU|nr:hypothetical protein KC19_9G007500 [Ceratodon purpureus]